MIGIDTTFLVHLEVAGMPEHPRARQLFQSEVLDTGAQVALAPQVVSEFLHVVADQRRFSRPLTVDQALDRARAWWTAREVRHVFPSDASTLSLLELLARHNLGPKRLLDTQLAATLLTAGVRRLLASSTWDFSIFPVLGLLAP